MFKYYRMQTNTNDITKDIVVSCPHCLHPILIERLNCQIFRHGTLKNNGQQMNPHETKEVCDYFVANNMIYGCGNPFKIEQNQDGEFVAIVCGYI
jgi:hypothetical protein